MNNIKNVLKAFDVSMTNGESGWIQPKNIRNLNLIHQGQHVYNRFNEMLFFDNNNELMKIKKIYPRLISGIFSIEVQVFTDKITDVRGSLYRPFVKDFKFREPRVNDIILFVTKNYKLAYDGGNIITANISEIINNNGKLTYMFDTPISNPDNLIPIYVDGVEFVNGILEDDNRQIFTYTPMTKNTADIYVSYDSITSISTGR